MPEDLHRAIIHELEHVRHGDWLTQSITRAITVCYWFHPLAWLAWRQLALEAERACDDAVLRRADPVAYADQLVTLAQQMFDRRDAALAMAGRGDLPTRVRAQLDGAQRRGPAGVGCIAIAVVVSTALVASMSTLAIVAARRTPDEPTQKFEVASVKPCKPDLGPEGGRRPEWRIPSPGRLRIDCVTLERIIYYAYAGLGSGRSPLLNVHPLTPNLVRGGPGWIRSARFDIEAKADGAATQPAMMGPMLRALLDDRFQLKTHRETEEAPMYALVVATRLRLKPIDADGCRPRESMADVPQQDRFAIDSGPKPTCGSFVSRGDGVNRTVYVGGETMAGFAAGALASSLNRFVIDKTGISGRYNIRLTYGYDAGPNPAPSDIERGPSIFTALQEQLGLKLENTKGLREYLVVDGVRRPDPN
jgi:uncharacterized protein (TIGR03435 family)